MNDLAKLEADLGKVPGRMLGDVRKAVEVASRGMKDDWIAAAEAANPSHARRYPASISYDIRNRIGSVTGVVGPALGGAGSLGLLEDANGGVRSAPQRNWQAPLKAAEADLQRGLDKAIGEILD